MCCKVIMFSLPTSNQIFLKIWDFECKFILYYKDSMSSTLIVPSNNDKLEFSEYDETIVYQNSTTGRRFAYTKIYYKMNKPLLQDSDFNYIKEIKLNLNNMYIVRTKDDIIKNAFTKSGYYLETIEKFVKRKIYGVIVFNIDSMPDYSPYIDILDEDKCISSIKVISMRVPRFKLSERNWFSVEKCNTFNHSACIDTSSCVISRNKCKKFEPSSNLTLKELVNVMKPYKYYILSLHIISFTNTGQNNWGKKPDGLWFARGDEWIQHMLKDNFRTSFYNYLYEIDIDISKMINITTYNDLVAFSNKFKIDSTMYAQYQTFEKVPVNNVINWDNAVKTTKKSGIIIDYDLKGIYHKYNSRNKIQDYFKDIEWYITWDVASGCVWNKKCIKSLTMIYKRDEGKLKKFVA